MSTETRGTSRSMKSADSMRPSRPRRPDRARRGEEKGEAQPESKKSWTMHPGPKAISKFRPIVGLARLAEGATKGPPQLSLASQAPWSRYVGLDSSYPSRCHTGKCNRTDGLSRSAHRNAFSQVFFRLHVRCVSTITSFVSGRTRTAIEHSLFLGAVVSRESAAVGSVVSPGWPVGRSGALDLSRGPPLPVCSSDRWGVLERSRASDILHLSKGKPTRFCPFQPSRLTDHSPRRVKCRRWWDQATGISNPSNTYSKAR